ncbi:ABC transporter ATP-binding protein [Brevibacillus laterosporus]|uniref:ABC transporter ATP-binding protein n=1 Tax=Brevibacillus laterosporus TaxID=1465 RepID=UPI000E6BC5E2|nr:ABC transporter ATP-binding protein [Brevibacillus laterosporus]AYB37119.1 ABC transporter ATP-binding protein [Brevibacillus laterosporus]MBM7108699.1 Oligopeptide transport ATP-binding protein OppD [Brevibacillus laterosporus]NKQ20763.1 ABC transporter ATP-binding protein [Brevibacillus laterosporus]WNX30080.1 ABC transporter ATP-binding protein [Brevibacillus laterosporus]
MKHLLEINELQVGFKTYGGEVKAVRGISFYVDKGEVVAIVGESGCGKSVTAQAIMGMVKEGNGIRTEGSIRFAGQEMTGLSKKALQEIRGSKIGMVFQDPMTSLNPTMKIGKQIAEGLVKHQGLSLQAAHQKTIDLLRQVGIPEAEKRYHQYPHEFSGGMRQRVVIAIAIACSPQLLIADEPTTALDVTIQAQILDLLLELQQKTNTSIIMITHDLGVVAEMAQRVVVMYAGKIVETGTAEELFESPSHPYTKGLLDSVPKLDRAGKQRLVPIDGAPPDLFAPPKGCPFAPRCPYAMEICVDHLPQTISFSSTHQACCWLHDPRSPRQQEFRAAGRA